jgi:hypothetical protein
MFLLGIQNKFGDKKAMYDIIGEYLKIASVPSMKQNNQNTKGIKLTENSSNNGNIVSNQNLGIGWDK